MFRSVILIALVLLLVSNTGSRQEKSELTVVVDGFPSDQGKAFIAVFRSEDDFPNFGAQFKGVKVPVSGKRSTTIFKGLPNGNYAVAVFHDRNNNGKLDRNMLGIPTEHYGFSNDARELFSAPSFSSASITLNGSRKINVHVR